MISIRKEQGIELERIPQKGYTTVGNLGLRKKGAVTMSSPKTVKGSLHKKDGFWIVRGRIFDPSTHTYKQRARSTKLKVNGNNKRKAEEEMKIILSVWESEANAAAIPEQKDPLFREYVQRWIAKKAATRRENSVLSYRSYADNHILPMLGDMKVREITPHTLQEYVNRKLEVLSVKSVKKHMPVIRGALQEAYRDDIIESNFAYMPKIVEFPPEKRFEGKTYTLEQISALLEAAEKEGEPIRAAMILAVCYGLRRSEIAGLRWKDVDFESGRLYVRNTKTQNGQLILEAERTKSETSRRTIDLINSTIPYLQDLKRQHEESDYPLDKVCRWPDGREFNPHYISQGTSHLMKKYGLEKVRLHDLRHTAATLLATQATPKQVQNFLGHSTIALTMNVYTHLLDEDRKATSNIMDGILKNSVFCSRSCSRSDLTTETEQKEKA